MEIPTLIYCADGNKRFAEIAIRAGFLYGAQMPNTIYFDPWFVDQDFKAPDFDKYMQALAEIKPHMASVIDWKNERQLPEVLRWAEEAARFVNVVMIIPKVMGGIDRVPTAIGGKPVRLGYSVPTSFGGTYVPSWEFRNRPVHLLGGSPKSQFRLAHYMNVVSLDGNMHQLMATRYCAFFTLQRVPGARNHPWPTLKEADGQRWGDGSDTADAPYEAFRRSCESIMTAWRI